LLENELLASIDWPDDATLDVLTGLNAQMRAIAIDEDWTPLVRINREFHLAVFSLSPHRLILDEVKRLWSMADIFIATKMSDMAARLRTVDEHDRIIESLRLRDLGLCLDVMEQHRASTASGLPASYREVHGIPVESPQVANAG
jgi:DNA-binding GntR family transcriptional regulator